MKLLIIFMALIGLAVAGVFQHQLIRVESQKSKMMKEGTWEDYNKAKQLAIRKGGSSISEIMNDYDDIVYLANVTVGTPEQQFLVQMDTGSSDFWIPDSTCDNSKKDIKDSDVCYGKDLFFSNDSSTYVKNGSDWQIRYGSGYCIGIVGQDTVRLGGIGEAQLIVPKTGFAQATEISTSFGDDTPLRKPINGILGLSFPANDNAGTDPVLFNAIKQGLLDKPIFTVYLEKHTNQLNVPGGSITYGGIDSEHCSTEVNYVPITKEAYFQFEIDSFTFGNYSSPSKLQVISDTGCTCNVVQPEVYNQITQDMDIQDGGIIDCNAILSDINLTIGGKKYVIPANQLIIEVYTEQCIFGIQPMDLSGAGVDMILGDPFIRSYCNVFHLQDKQIGFAKVIA